MEHVDSDLRTLWVIGRGPSADLVGTIRFAILSMGHVLDIPEGERVGISREKVEKDLKELAELVVERRDAFRADLGLTIGDHKPTGRPKVLARRRPRAD